MTKKNRERFRRRFIEPKPTGHGWSDLEAIRYLLEDHGGISEAGFKKLEELSDVRSTLEALNLDPLEANVRQPESDPPDVIFDHASGLIGVEHVRLVDGVLESEKKRLREGEEPRFVKFHPNLEPEFRSVVWDLSFRRFRTGLEERIERKSGALARWVNANSYASRWLLVSLHDEDHHVDHSEIENWLDDFDAPKHGFDKVYLKLGYDPGRKKCRVLSV